MAIDSTSNRISSRSSLLDSGRRRPVSLADQIWESLYRKIIHGELKPDERLVEMEIAETMGTSQGPVREALQRLEYEGLVQRHARTGTYVTGCSDDEMFELFTIRAVVEGFAARRTARTVTPPQCDELQSLVNLMRERGTADDLAGLVEYDMALHLHICRWSGSFTLQQIWVPLYAQIQRFINQTHRRYFADLVELADTHQPLVDALCAGNGEESARLVREHVMLIWSMIESESNTQ